MESLSPLEKKLVDRFVYICTALFIITVIVVVIVVIVHHWNLYNVEFLQKNMKVNLF